VVTLCASLSPSNRVKNKRVALFSTTAFKPKRKTNDRDVRLSNIRLEFGTVYGASRTAFASKKHHCLKTSVLASGVSVGGQL